ncbi:MAG: M28 family metallopeptidase, partial [Myxococcota bacterium]|nr:M28 family metallopeptidase [Myxococcota bacterium]
MARPSTLVCVCGSILSLAAAGGSGAQPLEASADRIEAGLRILTGVDPPPAGGDPIVSRYIEHPGNADAAEWIRGELADIEALEIELESFDAAGVEDLDSVIATLPGDDPALQPLLLGAHLDSIASFTPGWDGLADPAPGADDDASGVAAVMECARLLAASGAVFERDVVFTLFNAEEQGLLGSYEHVDRRLAADDPVALALILDPVGYNPGDLLFFTFDDVSSEDADALLDRAEALDPGIEVSGVHESLIGGDMRADHYPFWVAGWAALHLGTFPQPPTYHTVDDTLDGVDVAF